MTSEQLDHPRVSQTLPKLVLHFRYQYMMDLIALVLSFLLLLVGAALCSNIPQQELTWRSAFTQVVARSAEPNDNEGEGGIGSGGDIPPPSASPTPVPPKIFATPPYLPVPECANFAPSADEALPAQTLEQLQWQAMCELSCISRTVSVSSVQNETVGLSSVVSHAVGAE